MDLLTEKKIMSRQARYSFFFLISLSVIALGSISGCSPDPRSELIAELTLVDPMIDTVTEAERTFGNCSNDELVEIIDYFNCVLESPSGFECQDVISLSEGCKDLIAAILLLWGTSCKRFQKIGNDSVWKFPHQ